MKRTVITAAVVAAISIIPTALGAGAAAPTRVAFPVDVTYEIKELSALCGFEVWFRLEGTFKGTVFQSPDGDIVRELDTQPGTRISMYSPESGTAFSYPFSTAFHYDYPNGTAPGAIATFTATGLTSKTPGLNAEAGYAQFPDAVVLFVEDGVPIVGLPFDPATRHGSHVDFEENDAAVCAALAP